MKPWKPYQPQLMSIDCYIEGTTKLNDRGLKFLCGIVAVDNFLVSLVKG